MSRVVKKRCCSTILDFYSMNEPKNIYYLVKFIFSYFLKYNFVWVALNKKIDTLFCKNDKCEYKF